MRLSRTALGVHTRDAWDGVDAGDPARASATGTSGYFVWTSQSSLSARDVSELERLSEKATWRAGWWKVSTAEVHTRTAHGAGSHGRVHIDLPHQCLAQAQHGAGLPQSQNLTLRVTPQGDFGCSQFSADLGQKISIHTSTIPCKIRHAHPKPARPQACANNQYVFLDRWSAMA